MKAFLYLGCLVGLSTVAVLVQAQKAPGPDEAARAAAMKLFAGLSADQQKQVVRPVDDKDRYAEIFPTTKRPGLAFAQLNAEQKAMVEEMVRSMTSEYGATRCLEVAKQTGEGGRYLTFYGTPSKDGKFAWRVATHHLTLVYAEFGQDKVNEFGPILLGGNPVKTLWDEEDKLVVALHAALSPEEAKAIKGKGGAGSGAAIDAKALKIGDLGEQPRVLARKLLAQRLTVFSADRRKMLEDLIARDGGVDSLRIAFWGDTSKPRGEGGNYSWKIGSAAILCDWQGLGKEHLHLTVRARPKS